MTSIPQWHMSPRRLFLCGLAAVFLGTPAFAGCRGASSTPVTSPPGTETAGAAASGQVLPVPSNPITNTSTAPGLVLDSVLVENNVDSTSGRAASDHLEIAMRNTGSTTLSGFEVFYTFVDQQTGAEESYYAKLPGTFAIQAGGTRVAHFDNTGAPDHFPENSFSLYHTSLNALDVTVEVSARDAAPQTTAVQKDAGGSEAAD